jgi:hypothetical protein
MGHLVGLRQLTRLLALLLVLAPTAPSAATDAADAGFPSSVVVFSNGSATELWAAAKLAELLSIPLVQHPAGLPTVTRRSSLGPVALVGFQAATSLGGVPAASLSADVLPGDDSYFLSVLTSGDDDDDGGVVIASSASSRRGTMNGIFAFLRAVGFRFLTSNATVVPPKPWCVVKLPLWSRFVNIKRSIYQDRLGRDEHWETLRKRDRCSAGHCRPRAGTRRVHSPRRWSSAIWTPAQLQTSAGGSSSATRLATTFRSTGRLQITARLLAWMGSLRSRRWAGGWPRRTGAGTASRTAVRKTNAWFCAIVLLK